MTHKKMSIYSLLGMISVAGMLLFNSCTGDNGKTPVDPDTDPEIVDFQDSENLFMLNEGSLGKDASSILLLKKDGTAIPNYYYTINNRALGNISQDVKYVDGKYFVISQNNGDITLKDGGKVIPIDAMLKIIDANTFKTIANYKGGAFDHLNWPTHLGVFNENLIYIRDGQGLWRFDRSSGALEKVSGAVDVRKNPMYVANGALYATATDVIYIINEGAKEVSATIDIEGDVIGLSRAANDNLYVSYKSEKDIYIALLDTKSRKISSTNKLEGLLNSINENTDYTSTSCISAKGDTVYISTSGLSTDKAFRIFRHLFSQNKTKEMIDLLKITGFEKYIQPYQTAFVHPVTGVVYMTLLEGFGNLYTNNQVVAMDLRGDKGRVIRSYPDYARFTGMYFAPKFKN